MKNGWEIKRLPEIAEYFIGLTYSPKDVSNNGTVVLRSSNIQNDELDLSDIVRVARFVKETLKVRAGDVLMCSRNGSKRLVGKTAVIGNLHEEMTFGTFMTVIRGKHNPYLAWFFKSDAFRQQIGVGENTMINQITKYMLDAIRVPFPPPAEQRRIVGILDEAFDGIATAKVNAEKNLQNARALFESHLQAIFTQRGDGWVETSLGSEIDLLTGFPFKSSQYTDSENGVRLLRGDNIVQGSLRWHDVKKWPASDTAAYKRYELRAGDVVLAMDRTWVKAGLKRAQISEDDLPCLLVQRTARLRGNGMIDNRFLVYLISSGAFTRHILGVQTGIGVPHVSGQQIKDFEFDRPPLPKQRELVGKLDALSEDTQRLESLYQRKLAALDELKKSLLHRAFGGEL